MGTLEKENYLDKLQNKMDRYVHLVYSSTKKFPKEELYGTTSQLRRSALSVILNFIEGYARKKKAVKRNFWEISFGSLKESKYLLNFSLVEKYINDGDYKLTNDCAEEIGAMLWTALKPLDEEKDK